MRKWIIASLIGAGLALGATAAIGQAGGQVFPRDLKLMDRWLAGKAPGEPVDCIQHRQIQATYYVGDKTILYRVSKNLVYRNDPVGGCPGLHSGSALISQTSMSQLCRGDIQFVKDFGINVPGGSCALNQFVPYRTVR